MYHLSIDIETRSSAEIGKTGLYKYAQSPDFEILLFAYQLDEEPVEVVDLKQGEQIPSAIVKALADSAVCKHAYNAAFEWYCLNRAGYRTPLDQWRCTMAHGLYCGYTAGPGRHWKGHRAAPGQTEAGGGQGPDPVLLRPLPGHEEQRWQEVERTLARAGEMEAVQGILQSGCGDGKGDWEAPGIVPRARRGVETVADGRADERLRGPGRPETD